MSFDPNTLDSIMKKNMTKTWNICKVKREDSRCWFLNHFDILMCVPQSGSWLTLTPHNHIDRTKRKQQIIELFSLQFFVVAVVAFPVRFFFSLFPHHRFIVKTFYLLHGTIHLMRSMYSVSNWWYTSFSSRFEFSIDIFSAFGRKIFSFVQAIIWDILTWRS